MGNRIEGDLYVSGNLSAKTLAIPPGQVTDASVEEEAGIKASKLQHQFAKQFAQAATADAAAEQRVVHAVYGFSGAILAFKAGLITPPDTPSGSDGKTATVDLLKNGTSILSAVITLDSTKTARIPNAGTLSTTAIAAGDVLEVAIALGAGSTGTAPKGVFAEVILREDANPT